MGFHTDKHSETRMFRLPQMYHGNSSDKHRTSGVSKSSYKNTELFVRKPRSGPCTVKTPRRTHGTLSAQRTPQAFHRPARLQFGFLQRVRVHLRGVRAAGYAIWAWLGHKVEQLPITRNLPNNKSQTCGGPVHTCSEIEQWYLLDICFLIVSLTDLTFLPREIRDAAGDLRGSLRPSLSLFYNYIDKKQKKE